MSISVNTPLLDGNELKYVTECITTGWISSEGPFIAKFEQQFSTYVERDFGVAVSNGSAALDIAIKALRIGGGDEVIIPAFTIISPAQSIITAGATPVLVDVDPLTWNMDISKVEEKITKKTKAILVVHIYGLPVDMDPIIALTKKYNLKLIEDAAEMHGQTYNGKMCGSFGDISIFSFYPNKHITTGEGGMLVMDDPELCKRAKKLRNLCFEPDGPRFVHHELGWNYRMTNLQAALGVAQPEQIDRFITIKRKMGNSYQKQLDFLKEKDFDLPLPTTDYAENIYWVFGLVAPTEKVKQHFVNHLAANKIATRPFFWSMHEQPVFLKMGLFKDERYPNSERLSRNGFYLPSGTGLTEIEQETVIKVLKNS